MKKIVMLFMLSVFMITDNLYSFDMTKVVAYPVPFNPKNKILTVNCPGTDVNYTVKVNIFDINGDLVLNKAISGYTFKWNGRRANGRFVKNGLYILKVEIENKEGDYGKKMIRILVDY